MSQTPPFQSHFLTGAALVLLREAPEKTGLETLLIQRSPRLKAYPNYWAFPGGKQDAEDRSIAETALRELFEETALYLTDTKISDAQRQQWQSALNKGEVDWQTLSEQLGYTHPETALIAMGWRITPPIYTVRFEAAYFYALTQHPHKPYASAEAQQARWWKPKDLIARWAQGKALVPPPVLNVLHTLSEASLPLSQTLSNALHRYHHNREQLPLPIVLYPGVEQIPLRTPTLAPATHTNTYLVGATDFVIIDPATPYPQEQDILTAQIEVRLAQGHRPLGVLLTHHHLDHIGAAALLQARFQLPVMAHTRTQQRLQTQGHSLRIDQKIETGDHWDLPDVHNPLRLEALHTPGHAPGHLCFIEKQRGLGFVGDMVAGVGSIVIQHPADTDDPDGHMQSYLASLDTLKNLNLQRAFPAHGPMIADPNETFRAYIQHRLDREAQIYNALAGQSLNVSQLRKRVYPDLDRALNAFAEDSLRAHLVKLEHDQRIHRTKTGFYAQSLSNPTAHKQSKI